ncbi:pyocin knob domain-containing protein [Aeromonas popoffii]|uniref:pyocin knob domain-containing protein n=1 Tax=Aeromonas popoffii TaxID=70856 RepID=UPI0030D08580
MTDALKINKVAQTIDAINGFTMAVGGKEVYHPDNKPSAADLNVVNKAGDTMSGNLIAPKVLVSAAQGTEANALARKDYVDGKFATVTAPTAVLPMIIDANKAISIKPAAANTAGSMSAADKSKLDGMQGFAVDGKSEKLKGPINFDSLESSGFYNLYSAKATGSVNPPPFDYGTMIVIGSDKDVNTFVTQVATDQRTGISYTRTRNDGTMVWTGWIENANEFSEMGYSYHNKFEIGGDADTFYPVAINVRGSSDGFGWKRYCFSRAYNEKAPDTWNNKTHRGALTLAIEMTNDSGWGGNSHRVNVSEFHSGYTTVAGGLFYTTQSLIVWLRGGGATYWFHSDEGIKGGIVVNLEKYVAPDKKDFLPRTMEEAGVGVTNEIMPLFVARNGELYDRNRRVLVADGSIPMIGDLKIEKEQAALILKNAAGAAVDKAENYGRIRFEHATGDQHVELMHSVHDEYRAGYGFRARSRTFFDQEKQV